jgi:hypothetical protein
MGYAIAGCDLPKFYPQAAAFSQPILSTLPNTQSEMIEQKVSPSPTRIFVSYSHEDIEQKGQVMKILQAIPPGIEIEAWDDNRMLAGDDIDATIFPEIERTDVFLALISRNYLASAYCKEEMKTALCQAERRGCRVVPIIVRENVSWRDYPIGQNLALPPDGKAPTDWKHEDQHWTAVEKGLLDILKGMHKVKTVLEAQPNRTDNYQNIIKQDTIDTLDERGFLAQLKKDLTKSLSKEKVQPLIPELTNDLGRASAEPAVDALLALEPVDSIQRWTEITSDWFEDLSPRERSAAWDAVRDVHLNLLPRLIDPAWIKNWQANILNARDKRLLMISIKPSRRSKSPFRSVEVLVARVDAKCGTVRFYQADDTATVQAHTGQINTANEALRGMQKPTSEEAVQRLGRYLQARFFPDDLPSKVLQADDWQELNAQIIRRPAGGSHYYYLVIPEDDPDYGNDIVLRLLYEKMPNLPRVLLSTLRGTNPLICDQYTLEAVIDAFWDIRRMKFA